MASENEKTFEQRRQEFVLLRDRVLLGVGSFGLFGLGIAAVITNIGDSALTLALVTAFAGLLGAPFVARQDEKRTSNGNGNDSK